MMRGIAILLACFVCSSTFASQFTFSCKPDNDLYVAMKASGADAARFDAPSQAIEHASDVLLVLAEGYSDHLTPLPANFYDQVKSKKLRAYIEFPASLPAAGLSKMQTTSWERVVVSSDEFAPALRKLHILHAHELTYVSVPGTATPLLSIARVAGYDRAVYGMPKDSAPLLFALDDRTIIATSKLSNFITGRFEPIEDWKILWTNLLHRLAPASKPIELRYDPPVHPALGKTAAFPADFERESFDRAAQWWRNSRLLLGPLRQADVYERLSKGIEYIPAPSANDPAGDGSLGILEGYSSGIAPDGSQLQRAVLRSDCNCESAMVFALDGQLNHRAEAGRIAANLLNWVFFHSNICKGVRGDPKHPSFGHIAWGDISPAWLVANYGDDDARCILSTLCASAALSDERWNVPILRSLKANLRTTGKLGFRGDRIDIPQLEALGWKHFHDAETTNFAPHFEAYLWACYLWAYAHTHEEEFLDKSRTAIKMTMAAYPDHWRWGDNIERARMLLPLAWLARVDDTPEHRKWISTIASDLLKYQAPCGAIQEQLRDIGGGHFRIPQSNEAYGTGETPLIQSNSDCASDQLYTTGFALLALHEAAAATKDPKLTNAENRLAEYLCRIQVRSEKFPWLDGAWFRAFDFQNWDYWSSSADVGWGAWSIEAGWAQAWTAATLALRQENMTLWDATAGNQIAESLARVNAEMAENDGTPARDSHR